MAKKLGKQEAVERLRCQIETAEALKRKASDSGDFKKWHRDTEVLIEHIFGADTRHKKDFTSVSYTPIAWSTSSPGSYFDEVYRRGLASAQQVLESMISEVEHYWEEAELDSSAAPIPLSRIERLCDRFHLVARRLRSRHDGRVTLDINDEYDVQDLMHALLTLDFDDIRPEEWNPSYAGASSRSDFVLAEHDIVIEVKKTRRGVGDRQIGEQLIIDVARYQKHPNCKTLVCFVYDPEGLIGNPRGLEKDLSTDTEQVAVKVIVAPR